MEQQEKSKKKRLTKAEKQARDTRLKELAVKIHRNEVFTSLQVPKHDEYLLPMIFMPLTLMKQSQIRELKRQGAHMLYADMKDALPRGINGYPIFGSMGFTTKAETVRLIEIVKALYDAEQQILANVASI